MLQIKRGLAVPIDGAPEQTIDAAAVAYRAALLGADYPGLKPTLTVELGQAVAAGDTLFTDRLTRVQYTAPVGGIVEEINRGLKRALKSIVIRVDGDASKSFPVTPRAELARLAPTDIKARLLDSGLWCAFRTRPYCRNPDPVSVPHSVFVTAIDTQPLAADPATVIAAFPNDFADGLTLVSRLFDVDVFVCSAAGENIPLSDLKNTKDIRIRGPHPAGLVGSHIHFLDPVGAEKSVWHLGYQDVIAIGKTFKEGKLWNSRIVALGGPSVARPRLLSTKLGSDLGDIVADEIPSGDHRIISGSVLSGRTAGKEDGFLGRYHTQISVLDEASDPGSTATRAPARRFSHYGIFNRWFARDKSFYFDTAQNGSMRPLISFGAFEQVMPLDILTTPLLKSLLIGDLEAAQELGCLELAEEDLALCEFVCCSKNEYGSALRACLNKIYAAEIDVESA